MPRAGLSPGAVVDAAISLVDASGPDKLTLAAVAAATGVATPSLYKHISSVDELFRLVAIRSMNELADRLAAAVLGLSGGQALRALMVAYRDYAVAYPHRYAAIPQHPVSDAELDAAGQRVLTVILAVLGGAGLTGADAIHAARCVRAAMHGFAALQAAGAFQLAEGLDESYDLLIHLISPVASPSPARG
jgi:AcrR family transcriptional regulator